MTSASTMPVPSVFATCSPNTANAMKLKNAAQTTAVLGRSTRVDTTVAIEFAASCSPFMKSNSSATPTRPNTTIEPGAAGSMANSPGSDVLRGDRLDHVRHVVALVDDALDQLVQLLAIDVADRIERAAAEIGADARESGVEGLVGALLEVTDALAQREDHPVVARDRVEMRHHLHQQLRAFHHRVDHRLHLLCERGDRVTLDALCRVFDQVDDVVEVMRQPQDVLAVDRRVERAVGADDDLARDVVGAAFDRADRRDVLVGADLLAVHHVAQLLRGFVDAFRLLAELRRERALHWHQAAEQVEGHGFALRWTDFERRFGPARTDRRTAEEA